jgi:hypothetical protein
MAVYQCPVCQAKVSVTQGGRKSVRMNRRGGRAYTFPLHSNCPLTKPVYSNEFLTKTVKIED